MVALTPRQKEKLTKRVEQMKRNEARRRRKIQERLKKK